MGEKGKGGTGGVPGVKDKQELKLGGKVEGAER